MDYRKIHDSIIDRARTRVLQGYLEKHHIIPKCLGGDNSKSNIIKLTAKEHYLVHRLLIRLYPEEYKLAYALFAMTLKNSKTKGRLVFSSRAYEEAKLMMSIATKERLKHNNVWLGRKHSKSSIIKMKQRRGENHHNFGKNLSESTKSKISNSLRGSSHPLSISIKNIETGDKFETITEASKFYGVSYTTFRRNLLAGKYEKLKYC